MLRTELTTDTAFWRRELEEAAILDGDAITTASIEEPRSSGGRPQRSHGGVSSPAWAFSEIDARFSFVLLFEAGPARQTAPSAHT